MLIASCPRAPRHIKSFVQHAFVTRFTAAAYPMATANLDGCDFSGFLRAFFVAPSLLAQSCRRSDPDAADRTRRIVTKAQWEGRQMGMIDDEIVDKYGRVDDADLGECDISNAQAARVRSSVCAGEISKALSILRQASGPASDFTEADLRRLFALHPAPRPLPQGFVYPSLPANVPTVYIESMQVAKAVRSLSSTAAQVPLACRQII
jgi:hypothetical protein